MARKADWETVRVAVIAPPYDLNPKNRMYKLVALGLIRSEQSNLGEIGVQMVGGQMKKGEARKEAAQRKLFQEIGLTVSQRRLRKVGDYWWNEDGKETLTHLYLLSLLKLPERLTIESGKNLGVIWLGTTDWIDVSGVYMRRDLAVALNVYYPFNNREMYRAALKLDRRHRKAE